MRFLLPLIAIILFAAMAPAFAGGMTPPPGNIYDAAPFNTAKRVSSIYCGQSFACTALSDSDIIARANQCAEGMFGFPANMLTIYERSGTHAKCALPETFAPQGGRLGASAQWPICCVHDKGTDCDIVCHYYTSAGN